MKTDTMLTGLMLSAFLLCAGVANGRESDQDENEPVSKWLGKAPELKFTALDGREVDLAVLKGKVVLIDFWATWCGPCVAAIPHVRATYNKLHEKGLEVIGISLDEDKKALINFVAQKKLPWPQYFDGKGWDNVYAKKFGIEGVPTLWLLDRQGILRDADCREGMAGKVAKLLDDGRKDSAIASPAKHTAPAPKNDARAEAQSAAEQIAQIEKLQLEIEQIENGDTPDELEGRVQELSAKCAVLARTHGEDTRAYPVLEKYLKDFLDAEDSRAVDSAVFDAIINHDSGVEQTGTLCYSLFNMRLTESPSLNDLERLSRAVLKDNCHDAAKALAALVLANVLTMRAVALVEGETQSRFLNEARGLADTIIQKYAAVVVPKDDDAEDEPTRSASDVAKRLRFEIDNLMPGKAAPKLEGEDLDGQKFALAGLKGNVVLLQFWKFG